MKYDNTEILHCINGDLQYLQFKALLEYSNDIVQAFPLRHGGYSSSEFATLNLGVGTKDNIQNVKRNYMKVCDVLGMKYANLFEPYQVHGDKVIYIDSNNCGSVFNSNRIEADASFTNLPDIPLVAKCADCMTIVVYNRKNKYISAIHSGWKGVINNILCKTINMLAEQYNCKIEDFIVCIAPFICKNCFEVKEDVKLIFEKTYFYDKMITQKDEEHYLIDLGMIVRNNLNKIGIKDEQIHFSGICNKCNGDDFFSYRNSKITGIMGNFIMLK